VRFGRELSSRLNFSESELDPRSFDGRESVFDRRDVEFDGSSLSILAGGRKLAGWADASFRILLRGTAFCAGSARTSLTNPTATIARNNRE